MRWILATIVLLGVGLLLISQYAPSLDTQSYFSVTTDDRPTVSATAWGVYDATTGDVLAGDRIYDVHPVASLTKLMSGSVAYTSLPLEETTTVSYRAVLTDGRAGQLRAGDVFTVRELLFPLLIESSNDAGVALAEYIGSDAFTSLMNMNARLLGMIDTSYADPTGLSDENVSNVHDLAILAVDIFHTKRYLFDISQLPQYVGSNHTWTNVNPVAHSQDFKGGKHGYTDEANHTLVAIFDEKVEEDTHPFIYILLGSDDLAGDTEILRTFIQEHIEVQ